MLSTKKKNIEAQVIQERRGIVSKLEIEARMRENKAQAQVDCGSKLCITH